MRIACFGYRDWALRIYEAIERDDKHHVLIFRSRKHVDLELLKAFNPDLILFYGWSWYVPVTLTSTYSCLMLHPAPLPRYRGGSPLQHQIIAGEETSAVTIFLMNEEVDAGPIVASQNISLDGTLDEIFDRISTAGITLTQRLLHEGLYPVPQDDCLATYVTRRTPEQSEITVEELKTRDATYLHNKVRMLDDPYPNAYIVMEDGSHLVIHSTSVRIPETATSPDPPA